MDGGYPTLKGNCCELQNTQMSTEEKNGILSLEEQDVGGDSNVS